MQLSTLTAISPVDGRYRSKCERLDEYFSEYALMRYRVMVEVEYFKRLAVTLPQLADFPADALAALPRIYEDFTLADAGRIKEIEAVTNHDVKAVEYFIKERFDALGVSGFKEFIHFGLTSQDINNTATPLMIADALRAVVYPALERLIGKLDELSAAWADTAMLAHTHGQPASPTRLGKELQVFAYRLAEQLRPLKATPMRSKFGGATGNFNAHHAAYPGIDWRKLADDFAADLGLEREQYTTQISNYDGLAAVFDALRRINTIVVDLDRDIWMYISMGYFKQAIKAGEVGSSAMPHKVNPIDFENSEGNMGMANALLSFLAQKLPVSRLQRDLTDSTVLRNAGVPLAHMLIAVESTLKGLGKLQLNQAALDADLAANPAVVAEGIQNILRREGYPEPYEALKRLTRTNESITAATISRFIDSLDVADAVKAELHALSPQTYTGI